MSEEENGLIKRLWGHFSHKTLCYRTLHVDNNTSKLTLAAAAAQAVVVRVDFSAVFICAQARSQPCLITYCAAYLDSILGTICVFESFASAVFSVYGLERVYNVQICCLFFETADI